MTTDNLNDDYVHNTHPNAFTSHKCEACGAELRLFEFQQYETHCHSCILEDTVYLSDDNPYKPLFGGDGE